MRRQGPIALGNAAVAASAEVPHGGGILDQEGDGVPIEHRQSPGGIRADGIAHSAIEAVIDVGQYEIEVRAGAPDGFQLANPLILHAVGEVYAEIEEGLAGRSVGTRL